MSTLLVNGSMAPVVCPSAYATGMIPIDSYHDGLRDVIGACGR